MRDPKYKERKSIPISDPDWKPAALKKANGKNGAVKKGKNGAKKKEHDAKKPADGKAKPDLDEKFTGHDLGGLRVHSGTSKPELGASAYALGDGIGKTGNSFKPLIAHELTHVVQQNGGPKVPDDGKAQDHADQKDDLDGKMKLRGEPAASKHGSDGLDGKDGVNGLDGKDGKYRKDGKSDGAARTGKNGKNGKDHANHKLKPDGVGKLKNGSADGKAKSANGASGKPVFLKHPDANGKKENGVGKDKAEANGKKAPLKISADSKNKLEVPLDYDTLAALSDKMYDKLETEEKTERDLTGSDR